MGAADAETRPVRLVITTDCDAGFRLWPGTEPQADVPPGGEYLVECFPQEPVSIEEVIVRHFALVQIAVGNRVVKAGHVERGALPRLYRLHGAVTAGVDQCVAALLRNDGSESFRPKTAMLVRAGASSNEEIAGER